MSEQEKTYICRECIFCAVDTTMGSSSDHCLISDSFQAEIRAWVNSDLCLRRITLAEAVEHRKAVEVQKRELFKKQREILNLKLMVEALTKERDLLLRGKVKLDFKCSNCRHYIKYVDKDGAIIARCSVSAKYIVKEQAETMCCSEFAPFLDYLRGEKNGR